MFTGVPTRIADGDTLTLPGGTRIRFFGIDAPESDQTCKDAQGATWACGVCSADQVQEDAPVLQPCAPASSTPPAAVQLPLHGSMRGGPLWVCDVLCLLPALCCRRPGGSGCSARQDWQLCDQL